MPDPLENFEAGAGRLARQVVENATAPVKDATLVLIDAAFGWLSRFTLGLLLKIVAAVVAAIFLVIAVACGCTSAYLALASLVGPVLAFLIIAILFLVLSVVSAVVAAQIRMGPRPSDEPATLRSSALMAAEDSRSVLSDPPAQAEPGPVDPPPVEPGLRGTAQSLATVLGAAGLKQQQAGVEAGLVLADRLTPLQLAILGGVAAFTGGRDLNRRGPANPNG